MKVSEFDYELPKELIAQRPVQKRDESRLLVYRRRTGQAEHLFFHDIAEFLHPGEALVLNNTKVMPVNVRCFKKQTGGKIDLLFLKQDDILTWTAMARPASRVKPGTILTFGKGEVEAEAVGRSGTDVKIRFSGEIEADSFFSKYGNVPLPPYIKRKDNISNDEDFTRYQTIYAKHPGAAAAPTAGLHFTRELLEEIRSRGVHIFEVTLHVGRGTFKPVSVEYIDDWRMEEEEYEIDDETAAGLNAALKENRRITAVGTTAVRTLESAYSENRSMIRPGRRKTGLFIRPPFKFNVTGALVTNFHLPCSTLLMMVSALAGRENMLAAYREAVRKRYRFYSYGDAMLIV